jgi:hypothetical protein
MASARDGLLLLLLLLLLMLAESRDRLVLGSMPGRDCSSCCSCSSAFGLVERVSRCTGTQMTGAGSANMCVCQADSEWQHRHVVEHYGCFLNGHPAWLTAADYSTVQTSSSRCDNPSACHPLTPVSVFCNPPAAPSPA